MVKNDKLESYWGIDLVEWRNTVALESVVQVPDVASDASGPGVTAAIAGAFAIVASGACAAFAAYASLRGYVVYLSRISVVFVAYAFAVAETSTASAVNPSEAVGIES